MAGNTIRVAEGVTEWLMGTPDAQEAEKPYQEGERLRVTLLRHIMLTGARKDGRTTLVNLTSDELEELQTLAENCAEAARANAGTDAGELGLLNSANALIRNCAKAIKAGPPLVSSLLHEAVDEPAEPAPIEVDPLVGLLTEADDNVHQLEEALARAVQHRRNIRHLRDERIAHLGPYRTNAQLSEMFKMHASQVSRIISGQRNEGSDD